MELLRRVADRCFERLEREPRYPSLRFKRVGRLWSVRVDIRYRAVGRLDEDGDFYWFWIGRHSEYERILRRDG